MRPTTPKEWLEEDEAVDAVMGNPEKVREFVRERRAVLKVINEALYPESGCALDSLFVAASLMTDSQPHTTTYRMTW